MTVTTTTLITATNYNALHDLMEDIIGIGENGWGLPLLASTPTSEGRFIKAYEYNNLLIDINLAHTHITNANTSTAAVVTGTTVVSAAYFNAISNTIDWLHDDSRRYTCHPNQFFYVNLVGGGSNSNFVPIEGDSLRTLPWGSNNYTVIRHRVTCAFRNRLAARYYFNQGNYLTYTPYYAGVGLNDLDAEWSNFIDYLRRPGFEYQYNRADYLVGDSTVAYTSGTLFVNVIANRTDDQSAVEFVIEYGNTASPNFLISPAVGSYLITL